MKVTGAVVVCLVSLFLLGIYFLSSQKADSEKLEPTTQQRRYQGSSDVQTVDPVPLLMPTQQEMPENRFWVSETNTKREEIKGWFFWDGYEQSGKVFNDGASIRLQNETFDASNFIVSSALLKAIEQSKDLKWLKIEIGSEEQADWLQKLTKLEGLYLDTTKFKAFDVKKLNSLATLKYLVIDGLLVNELPDLPNLEMLRADLDDTQIAKLTRFKKLTGLEFGWESEVTDEGVRRLAHACPSLKYLSLRRSRLLTHGCLEHLFKFTKLEFLDIGNMTLEKWAGLLQEKLPDCYISIGT